MISPCSDLLEETRYALLVLNDSNSYTKVIRNPEGVWEFLDFVFLFAERKLKCKHFLNDCPCLR